MNIPTNPGRRTYGALLPVLVFASSIAWGGPVYTIQDSGAARQFETADDEVSLSRKGAGLSKDVKATFTDAAIVKDFGSRVVVRFPKVDWKKAVGPRNLGGAAFEPVVYEQGQTRNDASRRIVTPQVLASGANEAELLRVSGAASAKATSLNGYVMLTFATANEALTGTEKLRKANLNAEPQLRRQTNKRAVPNDIFFDLQWHLRNTGQGNGLPGVDINPLSAWDYYKGIGVTIAIVDDCLEIGHTDLAPNALPFGFGGPHHDFNDDDDDPSPELAQGDAHGTSCGGVAAGRGNNGFGVSGGGPEATLLGLRLISGAFTDADEQSAFTWTGGAVPADIDISSNSWGPYDDVRLEGPGLLSLDGLKTAATRVRGVGKGTGVVFCWAGGNGGANNDNVNMDGYANSRFVIGVGAIANTGKQAYYSESGSPLLVSAPSNGGTLGIFTTDVTGNGGYNNFFSTGEAPDIDYTNSFGGTSSAAPLVAGVVSLILEANPLLSNRDVMEIITTTASKVDAPDAGWATNGAGFLFNHRYGGGMVDATAAIIRAQDWVNLEAETVVERILSSVPADIPEDTTKNLTKDFNFGNANLRVEHVEVQLDIAHAHRSDLQISLISPSGHESRLIEQRPRPTNGNSDVDYSDGNLGWIFTTIQHWGEDAKGTWQVRIVDGRPGTAGTLRKARIRLYGTPSTSSTRFSFAAKSESVSETSSRVDLIVRRLGAKTGSASVDYYVSTIATATPSLDFTPSSGTLNFLDGEIEKIISFPIRNDITEEPNERFYVLLTNPSVGTLGGITVETVEIKDDDGNSVTVTATDSVAHERSLASELADEGVFTISRKTASPTPLEIFYTVAQAVLPGQPVPPGTPNYARHIYDYVELPLRATIPANATSVDVRIIPKDDRLSEGTELVELTLTPNAAYNLGLPNKATVSLIDNDLVPVTVVASVGSVLESSTEDIVFTITRESTQLDGPLNIYLEPSGSARPQIDYAPPFPSVISIPPNQTTVQVSIHANDNDVFNPLKTVVLGVSQGPEYKEGFFRSVEVRIFDDEPVPDTVKPTVTITAPTSAQRVEFPTTVTASGTAADNADSMGNTNAAQVRFRLNGGAWNVATLTNHDWTADITTLAAYGNNVLDVYSLDEFGNESKFISQKFTYVKLHTLTTAVAGPGTITADFVGTKTLEVGQSYRIVAKPTSGTNLFDGWSGYFTATNKELSFTMPDEDIALTATFSPSLLDEDIIGTFVGNLSRDIITKGGSLFDAATSGYFSATVGKTGKFSGKLTYGGTTYSVRGEMTAQGRYLGLVSRKKDSPLALSLNLSTDGFGNKRLTGVVSADGTDSEIDCRKTLTKEEAATATSGLVGSYTFQLPMSDVLIKSKPQGIGIGTLKLDAKGNVRWSGTLPDGTKVGQSAPLSSEKTWAFFQKLYSGRGVMLGTVTFDTTQLTTDLTGSLNWHKIGEQRDKFFPGGFIIYDTQLLGSAYVAPTEGQRVLQSFAAGNGSLILEEGNFRVPFPAKTVGITDRNKVTIAPIGTDKLELKISVSTGGISGAFLHPVTGLKTKVSGVVLQKTGRAVGIFPGSTPSSTALQTGRMFLAPIP